MDMTQGAPLPVRSNERWYKVVSPKHGLPLDMVLLGQVLYGQWTHWDGAPIPCSNDEHCERCKAGQGNRWTGYVAAINAQNRDFQILAATEGAARLLINIAAQYGSLRGIQCVFGREPVRNKGGKLKTNAAVSVKFVCKVPDDRIPAEFPIHDSLSRLWGVNAEYIRRGKQKLNAVIKLAGEDAVAHGLHQW